MFYKVLHYLMTCCHASLPSLFIICQKFQACFFIWYHCHSIGQCNMLSLPKTTGQCNVLNWVHQDDKLSNRFSDYIGPIKSKYSHYSSLFFSFNCSLENSFVFLAGITGKMWASLDSEDSVVLHVEELMIFPHVQGLLSFTCMLSDIW